MDSIVALRDVQGRPATKVHTRTAEGAWETAHYGHASEFHWAARPLAGFDDLAEALAKLAQREDWFVVRGDVAEGAPAVIPRTYRAEGSWLRDRDRRWLCVDIDGAQADPERCHIDQALELLPAWLQEAHCVWQYSSSHGVKPPDKIRLHLWFWLSRPLANDSLRWWARQWPIDAALYQPVQPHYVAPPVFRGAADPWPGPRMGIRRGDVAEADPPLDLVDSLAWEAQQAQEAAQREREARRAVFRAQWASRGYARPREAHEALWAPRVAQDLEALAGTPPGERHARIFSTAVRIASLAHAVDAAAKARPSLEAVAVALLPAERRAEALRRVAEGWARGLANPRADVWRP